MVLRGVARVRGEAVSERTVQPGRYSGAARRRGRSQRSEPRRWRATFSAVSVRSRSLRLALASVAIGIPLVLGLVASRHASHGRWPPGEEHPAAAPCASFKPARGLWVDEPQGERARWSSEQVEAEGRNVVRCKVLIGRSEAQIIEELAARPIRPQDLGGASGDDFRMWRRGSGPALYVTFGRGRAIRVDVTHPECDADIWDC